MTYRIELTGPHSVQLNGLTPAYSTHWVERVVSRGDAPWGAGLMTAGGDPAYRRAIFGGGYGLMTFRAADLAELIGIFDIAWTG